MMRIWGRVLGFGGIVVLLGSLVDLGFSTTIGFIVGLSLVIAGSALLGLAAEDEDS